MKIKGPGGPPEPPDVNVGEVDKPRRPGGASFAEKLGEAAGAGPAAEAARAGGPASAGGPQGPDSIGAIAAELKAGTLTPAQAVERVLALVSSTGPAAGLPDKVQAKLRAELETMLREDPWLAGKLRRLGVPGAEE